MSKEHPNVLWLMTDEQRRDSLGCYGSPWAHSPNLDRLAAEGTLFRRAVTPSPVCVPARMSILTGHYPSEIGVWWNRDTGGRALDHLTYRFADAGYQTATFGKQHYCSPNAAFEHETHGVTSDAVHYFHYTEQYDESAYDVVKYPPEPYAWIFGGRFPEPASKTAEAMMVREAIDWLERRDEGRPFLLRVSFNGPHTPVVPPEPFDRLIDPNAISLPPAAEGLAEGAPEWVAESLRSVADSARLTAEQIRKMRAYYYGEVAFIDRQFGLLLDHVRDRGLLDDTIVAFVSDHGTHLGDYGLVQKQTFYEPVVCVPMMFRVPGGAAGARLDTPVETRSLLPTVLELAGLPRGDGSLAPSLAGSLVDGCEPDARPVFSELTLGSFDMRPDDRLVMVRRGPWKLSVCLDVEGRDGALHNLDDDPCERINLYGREQYAGVQRELAALIDAHIQV